ncbi:hypothetical protein TRVL_03117 [Trypanosoma vivax]|nr:hypothetical protein TRVL_03117 [Trypanosoma vivax]
MFSRRVYASAGVPRRAWASLHIQSSRQAQRILPSLPSISSVKVGVAGLTATLTLTPATQCMSLSNLAHGEEALLSECYNLLPLSVGVWCQPHKFLSPFLLESILTNKGLDCKVSF